MDTCAVVVKEIKSGQKDGALNDISWTRIIRSNISKCKLEIREHCAEKGFNCEEIEQLEKAFIQRLLEIL